MRKETRKYKLKEDILSGKKDKKGANILYGKRFDVVTEISDCDNVIIVEAKSGDKYPVLKDKLTEI